MSTTKHTAEPWVAWNKDGLAIVQPGNACPIATILPQSVPQDCEAYKLSAANAARIVQCVNKLAGHDNLSQVKVLDRDTFDLLMFDLQQLEGILMGRAQQAEMGFTGLKSLAALRALGGQP